MVAGACHPSDVGGKPKIGLVQLDLGKNRNSISKITTTKKAGGVAQKNINYAGVFVIDLNNNPVFYSHITKLLSVWGFSVSCLGWVEE
jgi:hypothetical protein